MVNLYLTKINTLLQLLFILFSLLYTCSACQTNQFTPFDRSFNSFSSIQSFNVLRFGARGDGITDSTQAFLHAWDVACSSLGMVQLYVPKGRYVLRPLIFEGINCKSSNILFQIDGAIVPPNEYSELSKSSSWITFHMVNGLHIKGGLIDAKGQSLWNCKLSRRQCYRGATSLSIDNSKNVLVEGLTSINSQMFHISINACQDLNMEGMTITADANSPNTDGIHIERSTGVLIVNSNIYTGDDCISIGQKTQNVWIEGIHCGPGHGISIGSLGRHNSEDGPEVRNVTVKSTIFMGTDNGLRIKTWASSIRGTVHDIYFLGAHMNNVQNPIIIDQNYCPSGNCLSGQASEIEIKNVVYQGIHGTTSSEFAIKLDCSWKRPCIGLTLQDIQLTSTIQSPPHPTTSLCNHAFGKSIGSIQPSSCLH